MSPRHVQSHFSAYIDGTLSPAAVRHVEAHLVCCSECAQALAQWRAVLRLVSHYAPMSCPVDCAETVLRAIEAGRAARMIGGRTNADEASTDPHIWPRLLKTMPLARPAAALALLVLMLGTAWLRLAPGLHRAHTLGQLTAARDRALRPLETSAPLTADLRLAASIPLVPSAGPVRVHAPDRLQEAFGRSDRLILAADFVEEDR